MAHALSDLTPLVQGDRSFTMWRCVTTDNLAATAGANYFQASRSRLSVGDVILVQASDGLAWRRVTSLGSSTVVIAAMST